MTFFKNIHRSRRTGPNLMKSNCAFQKRKICGFNDKYPSKSINFVSLNFTIKIYLPLDIISLNFFVPLDSQTHHEHKLQQTEIWIYGYGSFDLLSRLRSTSRHAGNQVKGLLNRLGSASRSQWI